VLRASWRVRIGKNVVYRLLSDWPSHKVHGTLKLIAESGEAMLDGEQEPIAVGSPLPVATRACLGTQGLRMIGEVLANEGGNEMIAVVVAVLHA
jgi:hypothetical protein